MELKYRWTATASGMYYTLTCQPKDAQFDRWDSVAQLFKPSTNDTWRASFNWRIERMLPHGAYIFRKRWDDIDKAQKAVERKARGMVGVLQIQGEWP
jgi:hypothetical protein